MVICKGSRKGDETLHERLSPKVRMPSLMGMRHGAKHSGNMSQT